MIKKTPIYQQLSRLLRDLIKSGKYKPGDKFLTERAICEQFSVSRVTANKALSSLVSEEILIFKKGVGTFIKERKMSPSPIADFLLRDKEYEIEVVSLKKEKNSQKTVRVIKKNGKPLMIQIQMLYKDLCDIPFNGMYPGTLTQLLKEKQIINIAKSKTTVFPICLDKYKASLLNLSEGVAVFCERNESIPTGDEKLWNEENYFRPDAIKLSNSPEGKLTETILFSLQTGSSSRQDSE